MLVYTSYDGDLIPEIESFIAFVLTQGKIPLNPTKLLGYYISTIAHKNQKVGAMLDCISIELLADEFWIFVEDTDLPDAYQIPEGVQMELFYWITYKHGPVRMFSMSQVRQCIKDNSKLNLDSFELNVDELNNIQISSELKIDMVPLNELRKPILINIKERHHKYIDWVKLYTFNHNLVPIDIRSIMNGLLFILFNDLDMKTIENEIKQKEINEIHITEFEDDVNKWSLKSAGVPKYISKSWALTDRERLNL